MNSFVVLLLILGLPVFLYISNKYNLLCCLCEDDEDEELDLESNRLRSRSRRRKALAAKRKHALRQQQHRLRSHSSKNKRRKLRKYSLEEDDSDEENFKYYDEEDQSLGSLDNSLSLDDDIDEDRMAVRSKMKKLKKIEKRNRNNIRKNRNQQHHGYDGYYDDNRNHHHRQHRNHSYSRQQDSTAFTHHNYKMAASVGQETNDHLNDQKRIKTVAALNDSRNIQDSSSRINDKQCQQQQPQQQQQSELPFTTSATSVIMTENSNSKTEPTSTIKNEMIVVENQQQQQLSSNNESCHSSNNNINHHGMVQESNGNDSQQENEYAYIVYKPASNYIAMSRSLNELIPPDTTIIYKMDETSHDKDKLRLKSLGNNGMLSNICKSPKQNIINPDSSLRSDYYIVNSNLLLNKQENLNAAVQNTGEEITNIDKDPVFVYSTKASESSIIKSKSRTAAKSKKSAAKSISQIDYNYNYPMESKKSKKLEDFQDNSEEIDFVGDDDEEYNNIRRKIKPTRRVIRSKTIYDKERKRYGQQYPEQQHYYGSRNQISATSSSSYKRKKRYY